MNWLNLVSQAAEDRQTTASSSLANKLWSRLKQRKSGKDNLMAITVNIFWRAVCFNEEIVWKPKYIYSQVDCEYL